MKHHPQMETHPFTPFIPPHAILLIMGTFPPPEARWAMEFFYPNPINDFWRIMGLIFMGDKNALYDPAAKKFKLEEIKRLLTDKGIALSDTGYKINRLKGNASDKFLEIVQPVDIYSLLGKIPMCKGIATTGEKAADTLAVLTDTLPPKIGSFVMYGNGIEIWRMPSTSRAYPLPLEKKAAIYASMFSHLGIISSSDL